MYVGDGWQKSTQPTTAPLLLACACEGHTIFIVTMKGLTMVVNGDGVSSMLNSHNKWLWRPHSMDTVEHRNALSLPEI